MINIIKHIQNKGFKYNGIYYLLEIFHPNTNEYKTHYTIEINHNTFILKNFGNILDIKLLPKKKDVNKWFKDYINNPKYKPHHPCTSYNRSIGLTN